MTKDQYFSNLEILTKEYAPKYVSIQIFEEITRNDSLIKNGKPMVYDNITKASIAYFMLLNKPFPDFKFRDLNNNLYAKSRFSGKPTVVCFIHPKFLPTKKEVEKLNALNQNEQYQVVAFLADANVNKSTYKRIEFPVLKDSSKWLKSNFSGYYVPQYLLLDENGIISYFFPEFPDTKTRFKPLNEQTKKVYDHLLSN